MINKTYKIIHNKYLALFKFIFFLRYLFGIFFIAVLLFLLIPYLLDFKKKILNNEFDDLKNQMKAINNLTKILNRNKQ